MVATAQLILLQSFNSLRILHRQQIKNQEPTSHLISFDTRISSNMLSSKVTILLGVLATAVVGDDVFSQFYDSGNNLVSTSFDVSDAGCFSISPAAYYVSFSQNGGGFTEIADGPYCLNAWADSGCPGSANGQQQFSNVALDSGSADTALNTGVSNAGSYSWSLGTCNGS